MDRGANNDDDGVRSQGWEESQHAHALLISLEKRETWAELWAGGVGATLALGYEVSKK